MSWNLLETEGHQDRGRYLEELVFSLESQQLSDPEISYTWRMGYTAPKLTTYASNVKYSLVAAALVVPKQFLSVCHLQAWYAVVQKYTRGIPSPCTSAVLMIA